MKKKIIYLHIGTVKTGSSSVQEFLVANAAAFHRRGIGVITWFDKDPVECLRSVRLAVNSRKPSASELENEKQWVAEFVRRLEARPEQTFILTEECYWFAAADPNRQARFRFFIEQLQTLAEVRVIVYFRRQDNVMMSHHQQNQKFGRFNGRTCRERMLGRHHDWLHYRRPLEWLIVLVGMDKIVVRPFERGQFLNKDLYEDFLQCIGLTMMDELKVPARPQNIGLPLFLCEIMRCLSFYNYSKKERKPLLQASLVNPDRGCNVAEQFPTLSPADRHGLMEQFLEDNKWVAREMLGRSDGVLFEEPLPPLDQPWEEYRLDPQEVKEFFLDSDLLLPLRTRKKMCRQVLSVCGGRKPVRLRVHGFVRSRLRRALRLIGLHSLQKYV